MRDLIIPIATHLCAGMVGAMLGAQMVAAWAVAFREALPQECRE